MVSKGQFGVNRICRLTGISKTTYYQAQRPMTNFSKKYLNIKTYVEKVIKAHPAYGVKRIKAELEDKYQICVGRDTLGKLLKLWRLDLKRQVKVHRPNMIQEILIALAGRTNLLIRSKITKPFQALSSDITELRFKGGKAYLCVHKDVFGQLVYGWSLGLTMEAKLVLDSLKMARNKLKKLIKRNRETSLSSIKTEVANTPAIFMFKKPLSLLLYLTQIQAHQLIILARSHSLVGLKMSGLRKLQRLKLLKS